MFDFAGFFKQFSYHELNNCETHFKTALKTAAQEHRRIAATKVISDFVDRPKPCIPRDSVLEGGIGADIDSLGLLHKGNTSSKWLTSTGEAYSWVTSTGAPIVKNPLPIEDFQHINTVMKGLNDDMGLRLNSCLVSCLANGGNSLRLHNDDEEAIDQTQPIVVVVMGERRRVDFLGAYQSSAETPVLSVSAESGSVYVMRPGCQEFFRHRILSDKSVSGPRYSLSFRSMLQTPTPSVQPSPVSVMINQSQEHLNSAAAAITQFKGNQPPPPGTVPPPHISVQTNHHQQQKYKKKMTTVIFGTSITSRVVGSKLGLKGRNVINCSKSGARLVEMRSKWGRKVPLISEMIDDFYFTNPSADDVEKVILSFGTNDIKHARNGVNHLVSPVFDVINKVKTLFPGALIFVQCTLPMRNIYWYTAPNFLSFNDILWDVSSKTNCYYIDIFQEFLSPDRFDHDQSLFWDHLHLNSRGLGILCVWLKWLVNCDSFNPVIGM